jgi:hypothetical protein
MQNAFVGGVKENARSPSIIYSNIDSTPQHFQPHTPGPNFPHVGFRYPSGCSAPSVSMHAAYPSPPPFLPSLCRLQGPYRWLARALPLARPDPLAAQQPVAGVERWSAGGQVSSR